MRVLKSLLKIEAFNEIMLKITLNEINNFNEREKEYLLSIAILFLKEFDDNKENTLYLEFGYYLILKYSILFKDFKPLYDFSVNFGFYPIVLSLINNNLIEFNSLINVSIQNNIKDNFTQNNLIEMLEQNKMRKFASTKDKIISLVAPTSFGKSSLIIENIKENLNIYDKLAIIVPTKSLLAQTYKLIKKQKFDTKIIIHDAMYDNDIRFIAVLTQERALRLLNKNLFFECLYIDEVHKIFNNDPRSILLSRLIKINKSKNKNQKIIYLSPLISDSDNLKLTVTDDIIEKKLFLI